MPIIESVHEIPSMHIRMPKIEGFDDLDIDGDVTFEISGKPTNKQEDADGQSVTLELTDVKLISTERNDDGLSPLKKSMNKSLNRLPSENIPIASPSGGG